MVYLEMASSNTYKIYTDGTDVTFSVSVILQRKYKHINRVQHNAS